METKEFIFLLLGIQTFMVTGILFFYRSEKYKLNRYLGFFFLTLLIEILMFFIHRMDTVHPSIYYLPFRFNLLTINFLYLFAAETSGKRMKYKWKTYIPAIIEFLVFFVLFLSICIRPKIHQYIQTTYFWHISRIISIVYFFIMSTLILKQVVAHHTLLNRYYTNKRFKSIIWLGIFCILGSILNIISYLRFYFNDNETIVILFNSSYLLTMYYISIASIVQINIVNTIHPPKKQEDKNNLKEIYARVKHHMEVDKAYLDPKINLRKIALEVDLPQRNISKAINVIENKNFNTFINSYRIEEVKKLLQSDSHQKYCISAIADEVGFNSRASFYKNFKSIVGESPTAYAKNIEN
ncbi:helix-turn-helix domain-containing protein [Aquimarina sp. W85]|uniref:helix-turn-helix domain-containing protein n=1 Tax=Aquimarina rhodophyticola TaxID=3342246 RepID=UPI00366E6046